ncbi:N-acetylaspartate synthetase isoform X2 [Leucoraja erinacea]|uniref:N-acetylaspartate synthetase isoform X2 n=1 Tax=Leucoraja erinaceus TaxID=7782 RepID=UPI0024577ABD|nr:N-acetylaspartate synthetase isoform X2 [Leucoraja erinacea]
MPILPPAMVCQTKIVADEEMPGPKSDPIVSSSQMWPPPPAAQPPAGTSSPAAPLEAAAAGDQRRKRDAVFIREFEHSDRESVRRIFYEGIMERIPNTAFRGLKQQPRIILLYLSLTVMCFYLTESLLLICCVPILLLGSRYHYSRKVIVSYLECALQTDMSDIEQYYMKPAGGRSEKRECPGWLLSLTMLLASLKHRATKMDWMEESDEPVMDWAAFTTLCRFRRSRAEQLPYLAEVNFVTIPHHGCAKSSQMH